MSIFSIARVWRRNNRVWPFGAFRCRILPPLDRAGRMHYTETRHFEDVVRALLVLARISKASFFIGQPVSMDRKDSDEQQDSHFN